MTVTGALWILLLGNSAAGQTYTGPEVKAAVDPSIDILKDQVSFMSIQDRYDAVLGYASMTVRFAPMRFAHDDGTRVSAVGSRTATMFGAGFGSTSGFGVYFGAWTDVVQMGPDKNQAVQGIAFAGVSFVGFQLAYDYFLKSRFSGLDGYGNFGDSKGAVPYYSYAPGGGVYADQIGGSKDAFVAYHESGASLVVVRDTRPESTTVSEVRAQLQPLKPWLESQYGLPIVAIQKLADWKSYGDPTNSAQVFQKPQASSGSPYEVELGSDDLLHEGIRVHAVMRVSPTASFRRAELAKYTDFADEHATFAARAFAFHNDDGVHAGLDVYLRYAFSRAGKPRQEPVGLPFAVAASYSYNSPDASTFVPLPYAHVFGVQLVLGVPDLAKPLVPIVRPKPSADGKEKSN